METFQQWITIQKEMACEMVKVYVPVVSDEQRGSRRQRGSGSVNAGISGNEEKCVCLFCKKINHQLDTCHSFKKISLDDKWSFVKKERVCFSCLGGKHLVKNCPDGKPCGQDGCARFHNKLLHADKRRQNPQPHPPFQDDNADPVENANDGVAGVTLIEGADGPLGIVPVKIRGPNGIRKTFALLDSGATCSFIDEKLANELGIQGKQKQHTVTGIMGKVSTSTVQSVNFDIAGVYKGASYNKMTDVNAVGHLGFRPYSVKIGEIKRKWPHLRKMKMDNIKDAVVEVLVGEDHGFITMQREVLFRNETAPVGKRTKLGWFVSGKIKEESSTGRLYHVTGSDDYQHQPIKESFSLDNFGVRVSIEDTTASTEESRSLKICEDFYVNDVVTGEKSVWASNSPEVMQQSPEETRAAGEKDFGTKSTVEQTERMLTKGDQHTAYPEDLQILKNGDSVGKGKPYKLSPFLHEYGVIRLKGRIDLAQVPGDSKRPAILPPSHHFTELLIQHEHEKNAHQGQSTILNNLRQRYRIIDGRPAVKRVSQHCNTCRNKTVKPTIPEMGSLPYYRLTSYQPAFTFNGVDVFGPMEVTFRRHRKKRWGALFVCMVTRATHPEVAHGMSTDEMMLVFCRFVDCRGRPCHMFSDNGTNFVGAAKELKAAVKSVDYSRIIGMRKFQGVSWQFIPPSSPHMGGAWERMVKSVKSALSNLLKEKHPRDQTLLTALKAVENIVNSRPLTYVSTDPDDPESLTPNHFLRGGSDCGPSFPVTLDDSDEFGRKQWKIAQLLANQFWDRWTKEYLPELIRRQKWHARTEPVRVGDIVVVVDDQAPRNLWIKAVVSRVFPGRDGQVRVVEVTTRDFSTKKTSTYRRPVSKICALGLHLDSGTTPLIEGRNVETRISKNRSPLQSVARPDLGRAESCGTQIWGNETAFSSTISDR
ncbi:unnamed protein product [Orchesella dallaii]|uniref:Integrase catalytic domain-containing protein n=1 Tax=Orchesella dallaii TaxID=48710 RepID=A0ABP1REI6_9HEXA